MPAAALNLAEIADRHTRLLHGIGRRYRFTSEEQEDASFMTPPSSAAFRGSHLTAFPMPNLSEVREHLLGQDVICVGGGSRGTGDVATARLGRAIRSPPSNWSLGSRGLLRAGRAYRLTAGTDIAVAIPDPTAVATGSSHPVGFGRSRSPVIESDPCAADQLQSRSLLPPIAGTRVEPKAPSVTRPAVTTSRS
jgi:hypothetical protein